jgi:hypothetical protein
VRLLRRRKRGSPVAYRLSRTAARELAGADAWAVIEEQGRVVAESEWDKGHAALMLSEWLEQQGVPTDVPSDLLPVLERLAAEQDLTLWAITAEHLRNAETLARLDPGENELRLFHEHFSGQAQDDAGEAMLAWLGVTRAAFAQTDADHVVLIPILI